MDSDIGLPFDFNLHVGKKSGLFIELSPGIDNPTDDCWVNVDERVFGFIEMFLVMRVSDPDSYSHYGISKIQSDDWIKTLRDLHEYCDGLDLRSDHSDGRWIESGYAEIQEEFSRRFERTTAGLRKISAQLSAWTASWSASYPSIFIHGI